MEPAWQPHHLHKLFHSLKNVSLVLGIFLTCSFSSTIRFSTSGTVKAKLLENTLQNSLMHNNYLMTIKIGVRINRIMSNKFTSARYFSGYGIAWSPYT